MMMMMISITQDGEQSRDGISAQGGQAGGQLAGETTNTPTNHNFFCNSPSHHQEDRWVRLKRGVFKDDLARVDYVEPCQRTVHLRLIPRIDYTLKRGFKRTNTVQTLPQHFYNNHFNKIYYHLYNNHLHNCRQRSAATSKGILRSCSTRTPFGSWEVTSPRMATSRSSRATGQFSLFHLPINQLICQSTNLPIS